MSDDATTSVIQSLRRVALLPDAGGMPDEQLLQCFVAHRDDAAFEVLVRRHGPMVLGVCRRVLHDAHDADDAFQATFLVLVRKAPAIRSPELLGNWLYGVAYRTAMKARSMIAKRRAIEQQLGEPVASGRPADDVWTELRPLLDRELNRLPERYRLPLVLCELEGKSRKDAAHMLGVPEGTVSSRVARAKQRLRDRLSRRAALPAGLSLVAPMFAPDATALSGCLLASTVKAASGFAAGKAAAEVCSVQVAALTKGVLKAMFLCKFKVPAVLVFIAAILVGGFAVANHLLSGKGVVPSSQASAAAANETPGEKAGAASAEDRPAEKEIREKLAKPVTLEFVQTPLSDVIDFLHDYTKINILLDRKALEEDGVTSDTPVTIHVEKIGLASALHFTFRPLNLTWLIKDECLVVTSRLAAGNQVVTRAYPVGDLAATPEQGARLVEVIQHLVDPAGVDSSGERIRYVAPIKVVVVNDAVLVHDRVAGLFAQLRGGVEEPDTVKLIRAKLGAEVNLEFVDTPLGDVAAFIHDFTEINVVLDRRAIEDEGITTDTPVTIHVERISLQAALTLLLNQHNLTHRIDNECLLITTKRSASDGFELRTYRVGKMLGDKAKLSAEDWLGLMATLAAPERDTGQAPQTNPVFVPGSRVFVRWKDQPFPGKVLELTETQYKVQFRVGESEREEWVDAHRVTNIHSPPRDQLSRPVIEFYEPNESLVVFGPNRLHRDVENLIGLVVKSRERTGNK